MSTPTVQRWAEAVAGARHATDRARLPNSTPNRRCRSTICVESGVMSKPALTTVIEPDSRSPDPAFPKRTDGPTEPPHPSRTHHAARNLEELGELVSPDVLVEPVSTALVPGHA